jgi:hypothetical protein
LGDAGRSFGEACSGRPAGFDGVENRPSGRGVPPRCCAQGGWGPKMRHLVLYKLAGFFHADKTPCACFFRGAMLVHESQKNTVFGKFLYIFDRKMQYFHLFCTKNALFLHSRGTSVQNCKFRKISFFAKCHVCTCVHCSDRSPDLSFFLPRKKKMPQKKIFFIFFSQTNNLFECMQELIK